MQKYRNLLEVFPITLKSNTKRGRFVVATKALEVGALLLEELPTAKVLLKQHEYCQKCCHEIKSEKSIDQSLIFGIASKQLPITSCDICRQSWCSELCKISDLMHKYGCCYQKSLSGISGAASVDFNLLKLTVSVLIRKMIERDGDAINGTPLACLAGLISHHNSQSETFKAAFLLASADFISTFANDPIVNGINAESMVKLACRINANSHGMTLLNGDTFGVGLCPLIALINHSCTPNAVFLAGSGGVMRVIAIKNLKEDEEITVSYVDLFTPRWNRQGALLTTKFFWCDCERCSSEDDSVLDSIKCFKCDKYCTENELCSCGSQKTSEVLKSINETITFGMEMYQAGMFDSSIITLEKAFEEADILLHPFHAVFLNLLISLTNLYCRTNNILSAFSTCTIAIEKIEGIISVSNLGDNNLELMGLLDKYAELGEIIAEGVKVGIYTSEDIDLDFVKKIVRASLRSEKIRKVFE